MLSQRLVIPVLALVALVALVIPAAATTTTYSDPTAFNTATQSLFFTQVDFNTAIYSSGTGFTDASGAVFADILNSNGNLVVSSSCANTCAPNGQLKDTGTNGFAITLPNNIYAFAFYLSAGGSVNITFYGNGVYSNTPLSSPSTPTFFGATTSAPITGFVITGPSIIIDDFQISSGAGTQAAEAAPFILIGTGLVLLRLLGQRWLRLRTS